MKRISFLFSIALGLSALGADTIPANYSKSFEGIQTFSSASNLDGLLTGEEVESGTGEANTATPTNPTPIQFAPLAQSAAASSSFPGLSNYPQVVQNIVRATDGDAALIFDLIRNHVEFQPYFGFKKDEESVWFSRRANDADQTLLLVECLRAAGYTANYRFGLIFMNTAEAQAWFGADDLDALYNVAANAGYFAGFASSNAQFALEQIWCEAVIDGVTRGLSPAYKLHDDIAGIDLAAAMNYTRAGLLTAGAGSETTNYAQNISETGVNTYLRDRAMDLVQELQTNYPTASVEEVISGRRIVQSKVTANYSDAFYSPNSFISNQYDTFTFPDPYTIWGFNGSNYQFYTLMNIAVGNVTAAGDQFTSQPFIFYEAPSAEFSGKKISINFTAGSLAEIRIDGELKAAESSLNSGNIGVAYVLQYPFQRAAVGTAFDEVRIRPIKRDSTYAYAYDNGGSGAEHFSRQARLQIDQYRRDGLTESDQEILSETLFIMGLDWLSQFDQMISMLASINNFTPIVHHTMALIQQEAGFGVDIPSTTLPISNDITTGQNGENLAAMVLMGSAMEHGVIEQNNPDYNAVSTVRYVRENNLAGGKTFYATSANYATIQTDSDFISGWTSFYRNTVFQNAVNGGSALIIPEDGNIIVDDLPGLGYFDNSSIGLAALIATDIFLNGGFAATSGQISFFDYPIPGDPTYGPDNLENPLSFEPIDMLTGAYVYDGTDLSISGTGVRGLAFTRHYSSLAAGTNSNMGKGWSHNHQSSVAEHSDTSAAFGDATAVHASSAIAALWAARDMMELDTSPKAWVVGSLAAYWAMDETKNNTATIVMGRRTLPFTKLADASFVSPAGMTGILSQDGVTGEYSLEERFDVVADFNADNKLASITDADGNQMIYSYFPSGADEGKLQTVTDHYNRILTFTYTNDLLTNVTDSTGRDVDFTYTGELLTGVTDPENHTSTYTYNAEERIENVFNKKGEKIAQNTYDEFGQVCFQVAEDDAAQEWEYAFTGILNVEINPDDEFLSYTFDEKGRTIAMTNGIGDKTNMAYDGQNQIVRETDPRGNITRFEYDGRNNLRFTYDARNGASGTTYKIEQQYDAQDNLIKVIDEVGNELVYDYDTEHHLITFTDENQRQTTYDYYSSGTHDGMVETVTRPDSTLGQDQVTTYIYDVYGYPTTTTRPDNSVLTQTFNTRGDLTFSEITTSGEVNSYPVTNTYDLNRRLLTSRDSMNFGTTMFYDAVGNATSATDRFGNVTIATYSPLGRLESSTDSNGEVTLYEYDGSGRNAQITNALSQTANLGYDSAGRLESSSNPMTETITQGYDGAGNNTDLTNARNKLYQFTYNENNLKETLTTPLNRVFEYSYDDRLLLASIEEPSNQTVSYSYYDDELLEQIVDPTGTIGFTYNARGRIDTVTEGSLTLSRDYDALNRVTSFTDTQGKTIGYEYDGSDNLTTLTYPGSKGDVDYSYDNAGRLATVTDWSNRVTEFIYDSNSRLSEIRFPNGTRRDFSYDSPGRLQQQVDTHIATDTVFLDQLYEFDALSRISQEITFPEPSEYTIDPVTMSYDDDDRVLSWQSGAANISPVFDDDGNMTTGPLNGASATYVYDSRNRLTQAGSSTYTYDAEDRRITKTEGGVTTSYVYDPHAPITSLLEKTTGGVTTYYVHAQGQLLYEETGGQITVYHFDSRGSTLALSDGAGNVTNRFTYGAYGELVSSTATPETPFLYNGAYGVLTDDNSLLYMRARYYSVDLRRFINADPIGFAGGMNWFAYASGNPIGRIDPFGLDWLDTAANFSAGFGDAVSFGLTRVIRDNISFYDGTVDYSADSYSAGEYTAVAADIVTTGGAKTLSKAAAKKTAQQLAKQGRKDRTLGRKVLGLTKGDGSFAHHVNPLLGHPGGKKALIPTAGLPSFIRNSKFNLKGLKHGEHIQTHRNLRKYETLARRLGITNPFVTGARTGLVLLK